MSACQQCPPPCARCPCFEVAQAEFFFLHNTSSLPFFTDPFSLPPLFLSTLVCLNMAQPPVIKTFLQLNKVDMLQLGLVLGIAFLETESNANMALLLKLAYNKAFWEDFLLDEFPKLFLPLLHTHFCHTPLPKPWASLLPSLSPTCAVTCTCGAWTAASCTCLASRHSRLKTHLVACLNQLTMGTTRTRTRTRRTVSPAPHLTRTRTPWRASAMPHHLLHPHQSSCHARRWQAQL
jgi:hypothetical protein